MLDEKGFREFCALLNLDETTIRAHIRMVEESEAFLKRKDGNRNLGNAALKDLEILVAELMKSKKNTRENFLALLRYSRFAKNREVEYRYRFFTEFNQRSQNFWSMSSHK